MAAAGPEAGCAAAVGLPRFDLCTPQQPGAPADRGEAAPRPRFALGLCGRPLCGGQDYEVELSDVRVPRCGQWRCGVDAVDTELTLPEASASSSSSSTAVLSRNLQTARAVIRDVFAELEAQCIEERRLWERTGGVASRQKCNVWAAYTSAARVQRFAADSLEFARANAECRTRSLTASQLRFLLLLQHFVSEDVSDVARPELLRRNQDTFEGIMTDGVNSQLVKDAHRSEFSVDGRSFSLRDLPVLEDITEADRRNIIAEFQTELVAAVESYLLAFSSRKGLSPPGTRRLIQAVTTQMSQAGLANLDRGSQAARYFVSSQGLDQSTAYNLSTMHSAEQGECLKLSILCMKTGFSQFLERDKLLTTPGVERPKHCEPSSYLYLYATLCFVPGPAVENCEGVTCTVLDALDEARIDLVGA